MSQPKFIDRLAEQSACPWAPHPKFPGVALKTLAAGALTGGQVSLHLVRVEPGHALERHVHPAQCELHLVLSGSGQAWLEDRPADYAAGSLNIIPAGTQHAVRAGDEGLTLIAGFSPAAS